MWKRSSASFFLPHQNPLKVFEFEGVTWLLRSGIIKWWPVKVLLFYFKDKVSREKHKTIYSGLRISEMALSNQSDLPAFFSMLIRML